MKLSNKVWSVVFGGLVTLASPMAYAQETTAAAVAAVAGPDIQFEALEKNCGDIFQGDKCELVYEFTNKGTETLVISDVRPSCGCTVPEWDKEVAAGAKGKVTAVFNSAGKSGKTQKTITVTSNDPDSPSITLKLEANIKVEVDLQPSRLFFGRFLKNAPESQEVRVTGSMEKPLEIKSIDSDSEFIEYTQSKAPENDGAILLKVTLKKTVPVGRFNGRLTLNTNSEKQPTVELFINGNVVGDIELTPERLFYAPYPKGETRDQIITIKDTRGDGKFKITKFEDQSGFLDLKLETVTEGAEYKIVAITKGDIDFDKLANGRFSGTIMIETNHESESSFQVSYNGYLKADEAAPAAK